MHELIYELANKGDILVCKNEYVFTLLMRINGCNARKVFNIINIVSVHLEGDKEIVEVCQNDDEYLLLVLKP
jgi:hypothetical protein